MKPDEIVKSLIESYTGIAVVEAWGETSLFYNPKLRLPRGVYFATVKEQDGENDKASNLNREGIFRLNTGVSKSLYIEHFGQPPSRPSKGEVIGGDWDFTEIDKLMPHPVYAWMSWVAVNNPSREMFNSLSPLLDVAYHKATASYQKR